MRAEARVGRGIGKRGRIRAANAPLRYPRAVRTPAAMPPDATPVARVAAQLQALLGEQPGSLADVFATMQADLRRVARGQRAALGAGETLSTTALVNEAWLRLRQTAALEFNDRHHFVSIAARAMRHVLVDYARERTALKRGSGERALALDDLDVPSAANDDAELLDVANALDRLEQVRPRLADVVYLRYFGGLSDAEVGDMLGIEESTVRRDWQKARGWLYGALQP